MGSSGRALYRLPFDTMSENLALHIHDVRRVGVDWRIHASVDPES